MEPDSDFLNALSGLGITFYPISVSVIIEMVVLFLLLICSALISGSEAAYFSLGPKNIENIKKSKHNRDLLLLYHYQKPERLLATILISNNFVNVGIVIISSFITTSLVNFSNSPALGFIVQVILITFILLLFGEILPKVYASQYAEGFARFMAYPLKILDLMFRPVSFLLISSASVINKRFRRKHNISIEDLSEAIKITTGDIKKGEKKILKGIVKFGNIDVKEIMKSRIDIVSVNIQENYKKLISLIIDSGFSRIPVFDQTFDDIKGILYVKDLLPFVDSEDDFEWQKLIKPPYFVPETKKIDDLLEEFRKNKIHMAIVVDEYGGSSGLVTMEDIIEEIVGEINDDKDTGEFLYYKMDEYNYIFEGKILLNDFYKITNLSESIFKEFKGEAETLAGLILEVKGDFPQKNDVIKLKNFEFIIDAIDNRRIKKVKFKILPLSGNI